MNFRISFFLPAILFLCQLVTAKNHDCELIDYKVICSVNNQKLIQEEEVLMQINSRNGEEYTDIEIPYSKRVKVTILKAQIETVDGTLVRELKKDEMTDQSAISAISLYEDDFIKKFKFTYNVYPYRVRYSYRYQENEFHEIIAWYPVIHPDVPTRKALLKIQIPADYQILKYTRGNISQHVDTVDSQINFTFTADSIQPVKSESDAPALQALYPFVRIVPKTFDWFNKGSHESWTTYGDWIYSLFYNADKLPDAEKLKIQKLISGITNKKEIIKILYHFLQDNTRYINVSIDVGGLKPYPASYVSQNHYGDCKALSNYMKAVLQTAGIPAYYTTVFAGNGSPGFIPDLVCHQSNHVILTVPLDKDTMFLECTQNDVPTGYMGTFTQNRECLMVKQHESKIIRIPAFKMEDVAEIKNFYFEISSGKTCILKINSSFKGNKFDYFNALQTGVTNSDVENFIRDRYLHFPGLELIDWNLKKPERDSAVIRLSASMKLQNYMKSYGTDLGFSTTSLELPAFESPVDRKLPVKFEYPINQTDNFYYSFSGTQKIKAVPLPGNVKSRFGEFLLTAETKNNELVIHRELKIYAGDYTLKDYPEFYAFINDIQKTDRQLILITKN